MSNEILRSNLSSAQVRQLPAQQVKNWSEKYGYHNLGMRVQDGQLQIFARKSSGKLGNWIQRQIFKRSEEHKMFKAAVIDSAGYQSNLRNTEIANPLSKAASTLDALGPERLYESFTNRKFLPSPTEAETKQLIQFNSARYIEKNETALKKVCAEIFDTEISYREDVGKAIEAYRTCPSTHPMYEKQALREEFIQGLTPLVGLSSKFSACQGKNGSISGSVLNACAAVRTYVAEGLGAASTVSRLIKTHGAAGIDSDPKKVDKNSPIVGVQRLPRYQLLLKEMEEPLQQLVTAYESSPSPEHQKEVAQARLALQELDRTRGELKAFGAKMNNFEAAAG